MQPPLLLASSSIYRRELLARLKIPFQWKSPEIDETPIIDETPQALTRRLAEQKAHALMSTHADHLIIGSDQVCACDGIIFGKPHTFTRAFEQLRFFSGKTVTFYTGLCLLDTRNTTSQIVCEHYNLEFRELTDTEIAHYLAQEEPYQCAGSIKSEGLGIMLIQAFLGEDPTSLIGLPLIHLIDMLRKAGYDLTSPSQANNCEK